MKKIEFFGYYCNCGFELSKDVKEEDMKGYIEIILNLNKINGLNRKDQIQSKIEEGHLLYPGEMTFYDNNKVCVTGCCFDLNEIKETWQGILNSDNVWLGHDPDMIIKYTDDKVIIFESPDFEHNKEPEEAEKVEYTKEEINDLIADAYEKLKEFINIFYNYLKNNYPDIADILIEDFKKCLL